MVALLLVSSLGAVPLQAAQHDALTESLILAAEGDPTPSPDPTPTPTPTPKPTPKPTPWPTPPGLKGLDVSHWNGYPDFDGLHAQGMRFVFSKASQGTSFVDNTYKRHTKEARSAGLQAGAYHFFDYNKGGINQAKHFLSTLRSTSGLGALLPLVVDVETLGSLGTPNKTKARMRLHAMLDELYRQTGRYAMIYTSQFMWKKVVGAPATFGQYPLWVACWSCDTVHLPRGWSDWDVWQVGQFKLGRGLKLDGNVYTANLKKLKERRQRSMRLARGAEWSTSKTVEADLRGFDGAHVRYASGNATFGPWLPFKSRFDLKLSGKQGKQGVRVQLRSFRNVKSPILRDSIRLDSVPPRMWGPKVSLRDGARVQKGGARVPTLVAMGASDTTSGQDRSFLKATCHGKVRASEYTRASRTELTAQIDRRGCIIAGWADDVAGLRTSRSHSPQVALKDLRRNVKDVSFKGPWKMLTAKESLGRSLAATASRNATVKLRFEGAQLAVVARRGPAGGRFEVIVDGKRVDTVDLYAKAGDTRRIVFVHNVPKGQHVLKLRATGTGRAASSGATVWLDAILVLDRRS